MATNSLSEVNRIRELNDAMRRAGPDLGFWTITSGVRAEGLEFAWLAMSKVQAFSVFNEDNDPRAEHDFGAFELGIHQLLWKIDYYDRDLRFGSDDPSNPNVTRRILTIMLASEY